MDLLNKIDRYINNLNKIPYGEVANFVSEMPRQVNQEIKQMESLILELRKKSEILSKFILKQNIIQQPDMPKIKICNIGGIMFESIIIKSVSECFQNAYKPCCFPEVADWYFIAFPELGQVLPVKPMNEFLMLTDNKNTKMHFGVFEKLPYEQLMNSNFAVFPFNKSTWDYFNKIPRTKWNTLLTQMCVRASKSNLPFCGTNCLFEITKKLTPNQMPVLWAMFVQLYFLLFLFRKSADIEHFFK